MDKYENLENILKSYKRVAIAYSGGCDSNFLLATAIKVLGKENVLAIICHGAMMPKDDYEDAHQLLKDVIYQEIEVDVFSLKAFRENDKKRCYYCKKMIMSQVIEVARKYDYQYILDGQNSDDQKVYRPGIQACQELGILSPLAMCHMSKQEIREYSQKWQIPTYNKPANACLASRFDYHTRLTVEKLNLVDQAEKILHEIGIHHVRVRVQEELARIEMEPCHFQIMLEHLDVVEKIKALGFRYVTLDLEGIKSGGYDRES
ncbi:ATP-dependent sacrificial sulfur transferase LarE [Candidatus Stoquefichus sp. SB1]|uniref:ATP-dependent sacrificial sulfur transferase LarE n=1 Tax=Candidatus Stoquefichus sp. SB1 TaxID=1658109 RepID=UPI00067E85FB|nr:ATP-dependent sacrificial sulfur transferase LarE [Candidatus Stoquefichus sp. SB1]